MFVLCILSRILSRRNREKMYLLYLVWTWKSRIPFININHIVSSSKLKTF